MQNNKDIFVSKPYFPSLKKYVKYLEKVWENGWMTNNGPMVLELERKLKKLLGVKHLLFVSNGTMALQLSIKALEMKPGEIITTPLTYVATTTAIIAEGFTPVFADIDIDDYSMDPKEIEKLITKKTRAIMPVHVYGYPSKMRQIERIAKKHNLKVIYDAAHAFGTEVDGVSILNAGDVSALSFHATKLFHTGEGGAIVTNDDALAEKIALYRSFGNVGDEHYLPGVNGKNSELHAALGLVNLTGIKRHIARREKLAHTYDTYFNKTDLYRIQTGENVKYNFAYYPVLFKNEAELLSVMGGLEKKKIHARRYFYPALNTLPYVNKQDCPVAETISKRILCLPLYTGLTSAQVKEVARIIVNKITISKSIQKKPANREYREVIKI